MGKWDQGILFFVDVLSLHLPVVEVLFLEFANLASVHERTMLKIVLHRMTSKFDLFEKTFL